MPSGITGSAIARDCLLQHAGVCYCKIIGQHKRACRAQRGQQREFMPQRDSAAAYKRPEQARDEPEQKSCSLYGYILHGKSIALP